jgi:hypothetical protein
VKRLFALSLLLVVGCGDAANGSAAESLDAGSAAFDGGGGGGRDGGAASNDASTEPVDGGRPPAVDPGSMTSPARIYSADGTTFVVDDAEKALTHALTATTRHVIVYVHGRSCGGGGEPSKSLGDAIPEMESTYRGKVLMFNWPGSSSGCPLGFPEAEARASGTALAHVFHKLAFALGSNAALASITMTLVTHSMGNLVLEEALTRDKNPLPATLFATALLSSSATALAGHAAWLSHLTFAPKVYVSENDGDNVLTAAGIGNGTRLGKKLGTEALAPNAVYVDFTAANVNHAYYLHSGQKGAHMAPFYDAIMAGQPYDFSKSNAITRTESRNGTFVYVFDGR